MKKLNDFLGTFVHDITLARIPLEERDEEMHYYECRHGGNSRTVTTIEHNVLVNFHSTLVTTSPVPELNNKQYIDVPKNLRSVFGRAK